MITSSVGLNILRWILLSSLFASASAPAAEVLAKTEVREMTSKDTGRRYQIFTALSDKPAPAEGYAVVYVLDANMMFGTMVDAVRVLGLRSTSRPTMVIGIGYPTDLNALVERGVDLTPAGGPPPEKGTGGAEAFLRFIQNELKPDVNARYKIDATRETLFGHSYGGLFTLYTLLNQPALFDNFVAASPSIWFGDWLLQKDRDRLQAKLRAQQATPRVLITVGEFEQAADPDFPSPQASHQWLMDKKMVDSAKEFADYLGKLQGIEAKYEFLPGEDHISVEPVAIARGVRFALAPRTEKPGKKPAR